MIRSVAVLLCFLSFSVLNFAQLTSSPIVPPLMRHDGVILNSDGTPRYGVIGVLFSLYSDQQGGTALWTELQNVKTDLTGHYSVMLGSQHSEGVPHGAFTSTTARWLGVQVEAEPEQPRILLTSVPYAFKATDADSLGGMTLDQVLAARPTAWIAGSLPEAQSNVATAITLSRPARGALSTSSTSVAGPRLQLLLNATPAGVLEAYDDAAHMALPLFVNPSGGNVGIGTSNADSPLTVAGVIHSTAGGFRFPDGIVQSQAVNGPALLAANNTFTGTQTFAGNVQVSGTAKFIGDGSGLSSVSAITAANADTVDGLHGSALAGVVNTNTFLSDQTFNGNLNLKGALLVGNAKLIIGSYAAPPTSAMRGANLGTTYGFGFNIQDSNGNPTVTVDTSGLSGTAIVKAIQRASGVGTADDDRLKGAPSALWGDATQTVNETFAYGVLGTSDSSIGVRGISTNSIAVDGTTTSGTGVNGLSSTGTGVYGKTTTGGYGVMASTTVSLTDGSGSALYGTLASPSTGSLTDKSNVLYLNAPYASSAGYFIRATKPSGSTCYFTGFPRRVICPTPVTYFSVDVKGNLTASGVGSFTVPYGSTGTRLLTGVRDAGCRVSPFICYDASTVFYVDYYGNVWANGTSYASSMRWKSNIQTLDGALDKVRRLRGVSYERKVDGKLQIGVIAEEVLRVVPEVVTLDANGKDANGVDYARLTALLIEAVKEQQTRFEALDAEMKALKAKLARE